jgi:hypothetical protein
MAVPDGDTHWIHCSECGAYIIAKDKRTLEMKIRLHSKAKHPEVTFRREKISDVTTRGSTKAADIHNMIKVDQQEIKVPDGAEVKVDVSLKMRKDDKVKARKEQRMRKKL